MENSLSHRWRNIPPLPIMIPEAQRPFRQTHPTDFRFVHLPFSLKAQDHREALCPPLQRDAFSRTHDFIQLISKAITFNQTKRGGNDKSGPVDNQKGIKCITSGHFIISFSIHSGPLVGFKKQREMTLWSGHSSVGV